MKRLFFVFLMVLFLTPVMLAAQDALAVVSDYSFTDLFSEISTMITEWKSLGVLGIVTALVGLFTKILKSDLIPDSWFSDYSKLVKRFIIVLLGQGLAILTMVTTGTGWITACVAGLITSGGAIAIYHAGKALFGK